MTELAEHDQRWIGRPTPKESPRLRLICLPFAGGGSMAFRPWVKHLPKDVELCAVQLPGRETRMREQPYTSIAELVPELVRAIAPLMDRPYVLFGHSMGALLAFELARHVRAGGILQPEHIFVSGRRAPQIPELDSPLHELSDAAFVVALVRRYNGIPKTLLQNVDMLRLYLPTLRADLTMIETYRYTESTALEAPISAFGGWDDARTNQVDLVAWREMTRGDFALHMFPGGHFFIQTSQEAVLEHINQSLVASVHAHSPGVLVP